MFLTDKLFLTDSKPQRKRNIIKNDEEADIMIRFPRS